MNVSAVHTSALAHAIQLSFPGLKCASAVLRYESQPLQSVLYCKHTDQTNKKTCARSYNYRKTNSNLL